MRRNLFVMTMLIVGIALICLSSVSAADDNSTVETVDDVSQDADLVIDDVNVDDAVPIEDDDGVDVESDDVEKEYESKGVFVYVDCHSGVENSFVTITPTIRDSTYVNSNVITGGILKVYADYHRTILLDTIVPGNGTSFRFMVPECPDGLRSLDTSLWYVYEKFDEANNVYYHSKDSSAFSIMKENNMEISAKGDKTYRIIDGVLNIVEGDSLFISLDHINFWDTTFSDISVFIEGMGNRISVFDKWNRVREIKDLPAGEYVIYATYDGYSYDHYFNGGNHFAPCISNKVTVKVNPTKEVNILPKTAPLQSIPVLDDALFSTSSTLAMPFIPELLTYVKENVGIYFDTVYGVENSQVIITPTIYDKDYDVITGGILKVYSDYLRTDLIAVLDLDKETSFCYNVPGCPDGVSSVEFPLFCDFEKYDDRYNIFYKSMDDVIFHSMDTNNFEISVKDAECNYDQNGSIVIGEGDTVSLVIDHLDYKIGASHIKIKVEGVDNNRCFMQEFNFDYAAHEILIDGGHFPAGEYVIYAVCDEYVADGLYLPSAVSNYITVKVVQEVNFLEVLKGIFDAIKNIEVPA
jgi:hypothetical protein